MTSMVSVAETGPAFAQLADGSFVPTRHIAELAWHAPDFVAVAERFLGAPYLWGGKTRPGLDCSGLVQVAMQTAGLECPRDSDMQQVELGGEVPIRASFDELARGDLVFWPSFFCAASFCCTWLSSCFAVGDVASSAGRGPA